LTYKSDKEEIIQRIGIMVFFMFFANFVFTAWMMRIIVTAIEAHK